MGLSPIENNLNFPQLTGQSRKVGAVHAYQPYEGKGVSGGAIEAAPARAVDRLPKGEMVDYLDHTPAQAGYELGISRKTLWA